MAKELFLAGLQSLFNSPTHSDFTVTCGERTWKVHKLVLCTQSSFFAKVSEGGFQEAESGVVDLKDEPEVVDAMLRFLYTFEYNDENISAQNRMPFAIRTFIVADKYDIEPLKEQAAGRFMALTSSAPCGNAFSSAVKLIYENTVDSGTNESMLRNTAVEYGWTRYRELIANDSGFKQALEEVAGFGSGMVAAKIEERVTNTSSAQDAQQTVDDAFDFDVMPKRKKAKAKTRKRGWLPDDLEDFDCVV